MLLCLQGGGEYGTLVKYIKSDYVLHPGFAGGGDLDYIILVWSLMSFVMASIGTAHRHSGHARWCYVAELSSGDVRDGIGVRHATWAVQT